MHWDSDRVRQAAHVWLDAIEHYEDDGRSGVVDEVWERMGQVHAFTSSFNDETDVLTLDATPAIGSALMLLRSLLHGWAGSADVDVAVLIDGMRTVTDNAFPADG